MPEINIDLNFLKNKKTIRLIDRLGRGSEVLLLRLWLYCGSNHPDDGKLAGYTASGIETIVQWWGKKGAMMEAMLSLDNPQFAFLRALDCGGYECVNWDEHQGHLREYHLRAKLAAKARWDKKPRDATSNATSNATSILQAMPIRNETLRNEEKERESAPDGAPLVHGKKAKPPKEYAESAVIPPELAAIPGFSDVWQKWLQFRRSVKRNPVTKDAAENQFKRLLKCADPVQCIQDSLDNQYQGLFPEKAKYGNRNTIQSEDRWGT